MAAYSVTCSKEFGENTRQELKFAGGPNELVVNETTRVHLILHALEQERVLADLPELHQLITQPLYTTGFPIRVVDFQFHDSETD